MSTARQSHGFSERVWLVPHNVRMMYPLGLGNITKCASSQKVFDALSFTQKGTTLEEILLLPPNTDVNTPEGVSMRGKWLRAWVEISSWIHFQRMICTHPLLEVELN